MVACVARVRCTPSQDRVQNAREEIPERCRKVLGRGFADSDTRSLCCTALPRNVRNATVAPPLTIRRAFKVPCPCL
jgi:hypothetical protein